MGGGKGAALPFGWYPYDLSTGQIGTRDLFTFLYRPSSEQAVAFSISQSKLVYEAPPKSLGATLMGTKTSSADVVAVLNGRRLVVASSDWSRTSPNWLSIAFVGVIDLDERGNEPNVAKGAKLSGVLTLPNSANARLARDSIQIAFVAAPSTLVKLDWTLKELRLKNPGGNRIGLPRRQDTPLSLDWHRQGLVYKSAAASESPSELRGGKNIKVVSPPGAVQRMFYSRGKLFSVSSVRGQSILFEATPDRKRWKQLGAYTIYGQSASERYWLVQHGADRKYYLVDFGPTK